MTERTAGPTAPAAGQDANPVGVLLRGAAVPALAAVAVLALAGLLVSPGAATSALVGGGMAGVALAIGPVLHQFCRRLDPSLVLGIAILGYCAALGLTAIGYSLVRDASWLVGGFAGGGVFVAVAAWVIGSMRASVKLRQFLYGDLD